MDRTIVYPGAIPQDTDILYAQRHAMIGLGALAQATLGTGTVVDGLACTPTSPASLTVNVGPGSITAYTTVDATAFGSIAADTADSLVKTGINLATTPFTLTAPTVSGQSVTYLIEASFSETDANPVILPYYNAANPAQPYTGPNNAGTAQNTRRTERVGLQLKAGAAANTGSQTVPAIDAGWVGLYTITVNYGQTTITAANITVLASAPFLPVKLPGLAAAVQAQAGNFAADTGVVNALAVTLTPVPAPLTIGMPLCVKVAATNTGTATLNVNGLGAAPVLRRTGATLLAGDLVAGELIDLVYNGAGWVLNAPTPAEIAAAAQAATNWVADTGAVNVLAASLTPVPTLINGLVVRLYVGHANTSTAVTFNLNGTGALPVVRRDGTALVAGDLAAGQTYTLLYINGSWLVLETLPSQALATAAAAASNFCGDTGAVNALAASLTPAPTQATGLVVRLYVGHANTSTGVTFNLNGAGALPVTRHDNAALVAADLAVGQTYTLVYINGTWVVADTLPSQIQSIAQAANNWAPDSGAVNALVATLSPVPVLATGLVVRLYIGHTTTSAAVTFNLNGTGAQPVVRHDGTALVAGDLAAGQTYTLVYVGSSWTATDTLPSQYQGRLIQTLLYSTAGTYTYTPSTGARYLEVEVQGAGGGGGGAVTTASGYIALGGGGGGGGWAFKRITGPAASYAVTVGAAGAGAAGAAGTAGGSSSFGSAASATGGSGGTLGPSAASGTTFAQGGGTGGAGSGGDINASGAPGGYALYNAVPVSGSGGVSHYGGGAGWAIGTASGTAAGTPGAGGGGGSTLAGGPAGGGSGGAGLVIVREYY